MSGTDVPVSKPSGDYALNIVQNPALLEVAYRAIDQGASSEEALQEALAVDQKTIDLITTGLRVYGLGGKSDFEYELTPLEYGDPTSRTAFRLQVLHSVASEAKPSDWGMQSAVLLNFEYLLKNNIHRFAQSDEGLIRDIDEWHQDVGYEPQSSKGRSKLNKPKFSMWTNQATYLGLLHPYTDGRKSVFVTQFDPELVRRTIEIGVETSGDGEGIIFEDYLRWLGQNFIRLPTGDDLAVPKPFARTLFRLVEDETIQITKSGDPTTVTLPGIPSHDRIAQKSNYIRLQP